jgi:hypothetical protein
MRRSPYIASAAALGLLLSASAAAQKIAPYPAGKIWVDPTYGNDANNGTVFAPLRSITQALVRSNPLPPGFTDMVIMLKPGIYSSVAEGGGEVYPLQMTKNTSLQGASAVNTIIKNVDESGSVTMLFRASEIGEFDRVFVDGVNIHFGRIGVLIINDGANRFASRPTFSNCFVTDFSDFGVQIISSPNGSPLDEVACPHPALAGESNFIVHRPKFLNCTFRINRHSVYNGTSATQFAHPDDPPILGVSQPGFLNVLSADSKIGGMPKDDFVGIDAADLDVVGVGTTCIFDRANPIGLFNPTGPFGCTSPAFAPVPLFTAESVVQSAGAPLFLEDTVGNPIPFTFGGDLRLNPQLFSLTSQSPIDAGHLPAGNTVSWSNGTTATLSLSRWNMVYYRALDDDCEGFCNPRVNDGAIDVGADEVGDLITAGYRTRTTAFNNGDTIYRWVGPGVGGSVARFSVVTVIAGYPPVFQDAHLFPYVSKPPATVSPYTIAGFAGQACLSQSAVSGSTLANLDPIVPAAVMVGVPVTVLVNEQVLDPGSPSKISNLQSFTVTR